jgi:hypothetical protein
MAKTPVAEETPVEEEAAEEETPEEEAFDSSPDVGDISDKKHKGEVGPVVLAGLWVKLGSGKDVPDEAKGKIGVVLESPWTNAPWSSFQDMPVQGYVLDEEKDFVVKLRDETDGIVSVPADAIEEFASSRAALLNFA